MGISVKSVPFTNFAQAPQLPRAGPIVMEDSEPWSVPITTTSEPLSTAGVRRKLHAEGYRVGFMSGVDEAVRIGYAEGFSDAARAGYAEGIALASEVVAAESDSSAGAPPAAETAEAAPPDC